jgi:phospholipase/carboxylesterase
MESGGVLVHGRNRTPEEMLDLSSRLNLDNIHWLAPSAGPGRSWYPGVMMDPIASNEPALTQAIARIDSAVESVGENGVVMMGFSQGACLTIEYALRHPGRCRTLIALTGGLIGPPGTEWRGSPTMLSGTRVLLTGSDVDEWIPEARARETARVLEGFGAAVDLRIYPGRSHEVSAAELQAAARFIKNHA